MKRISRIPSCCSVRAVLRCYPLSLPLMRWVWIVQWWIGDGVMADGQGGWPDLQGEDRVLRERLSATLQLSLFVDSRCGGAPANFTLRCVTFTSLQYGMHIA